jgi:serine protease AprX
MERRPLLAIVLLAAMSSTGGLPARHAAAAMDAALQSLADRPQGVSHIIIRTSAGIRPDALIRAHGGRPGRFLPALHAQAAVVADTDLHALATTPGVEAISLDRPVRGTVDPTAATTGATWVRENLGVDGTGVGVAIIDSGVASWHDDLSDKVTHFVDFVDGQPSAYDDYGHGTHVAGIIGGSIAASRLAFPWWCSRC